MFGKLGDKKLVELDIIKEAKVNAFGIEDDTI